MKIALVFGGNSYEHDVSIISSRIIRKMFSLNDQIYNLLIDYDNQVYLVKDLMNLKRKKKIQFINQGIKNGFQKIQLDVLVSVMHGANGEDGLIASLANFYNIPYAGSNNISAGILMDKYYTYSVLKSNDVPVLDTIILEEDNEDNLMFPLILKPSNLGSSIGIEIAFSLVELMHKLPEAMHYDKRVIGQKYLTDFYEVNQAAYLKNGEIILSRIEMIKKNNDILSFNDKYLAAKLPKERNFVDNQDLISQVSSITKKVYELFMLSGVVRFDYLVSNNQVYLNEINPTPGSLAYYLFSITKEALMTDLLYQALKEFKERKKLKYASLILEHSQMIKK